MATTSEQKARRKRRRQRRAVMIAGFAIIAVGLAWFFESQATTTVIVTRYADTAQLAGSDPGLNAAGQIRAEELARLLGDVDVVAGIDAIFVLANKRTRETAMPLAMRTEAPVHTVESPEDEGALVERILTDYKGKIVLVVTEPEFMQPVIAEMHGSKKLPEMGETEYDNLYIVSIPWFGKVKTLRLRWGRHYVPPA